MTVDCVRYVQWLLAFSVLFAITHAGLYTYNYQVTELPWLILQLIDLDEENNLPTWFSSFLLLNNAAVLWLMSLEKEVHKFHWQCLAIGFLVLSIDEVAGMHESLNTAIEMNWAILGAVLVAVIGLFYLPFLAQIERRLAVLYVIAGVLYVGGAIGVELLAEDMEEESLVYEFAACFEETLEMLGALLFLHVNLGELRGEKTRSLQFV